MHNPSPYESGLPDEGRKETQLREWIYLSAVPIDLVGYCHLSSSNEPLDYFQICDVWADQIHGNEAME